MQPRDKPNIGSNKEVLNELQSEDLFLSGQVQSNTKKVNIIDTAQNDIVF